MAETIYDVAVIGAGPAGGTSRSLSEPSNAACACAAFWKGEF